MKKKIISLAKRVFQSSYSKPLYIVTRIKSRAGLRRGNDAFEWGDGQTRRAEDHLLDAGRLEENRAQGNPPRHLPLVLLRGEDRRARAQRLREIIAPAHPRGAGHGH